jgi:hypothetical protein
MKPSDCKTTVVDTGLPKQQEYYGFMDGGKCFTGTDLPAKKLPDGDCLTPCTETDSEAVGLNCGTTGSTKHISIYKVDWKTIEAKHDAVIAK